MCISKTEKNNTVIKVVQFNILIIRTLRFRVFGVLSQYFEKLKLLSYPSNKITKRQVPPHNYTTDLCTALL